VTDDRKKKAAPSKTRVKEKICKSMSFEKRAEIVRFEDIYLIDERIRELVLRINALPDICTTTSCGGHADPDAAKRQRGIGEFEVGFFVKPTHKGIRSLGIIDQAASNIDDENISIQCWNHSINPDFISFVLVGKNMTDPKKLADEIYTLGKIWIEGIWTNRAYF
jgi:hypothetical protein